ncbi:hypothetical protein HK405_010272, partial [Cladochytrium tenue]
MPAVAPTASGPETWRRSRVGSGFTDATADYSSSLSVSPLTSPHRSSPLGILYRPNESIYSQLDAFDGGHAAGFSAPPATTSLVVGSPTDELGRRPSLRRRHHQQHHVDLAGRGLGVMTVEHAPELERLLSPDDLQHDLDDGDGADAGPGQRFGAVEADLPVRIAIVRRVSWLAWSADVGLSALKSIPAVMLGLILNLLDALSYGIIIFPALGASIPASAPQAGISMFLLSTIICQLVFSLGGSKFPGANGSMMIEVMPFLHIMVYTIEETMAGSPSESILATIMVAYTISTLLTGVAFLLLGFFKLGNLIQFFPRHILVGCIGGIGWFLFVTGVEVTTGLHPAMQWDFFIDLFRPWNLFLWGSSLSLALFLKGIQQYLSSPLVVPCFYMLVPVFFYGITLGLIGLDVSTMRKWGLLFNVEEGEAAPFWTFWTYFNGFHGINPGAILNTLGTQLALVFFAILHVPINVPALAVSLHQSVNVNHELIGHGVSNFLAGLVGVPQSYLVYSNSLLFIRSGGDTFVSGVMLAIATSVVLVAGNSIIGFVPTLVVGSLIFHLAFDLMKESLVDTWESGISSLEYGTIVTIVLIMGVFGFTEGIIAGVILACFFFVVMYSRKSIIRAVYSGAEIWSTVHRSDRQRRFLEEVSDQITVVKIHGFIFFGVVSQLEAFIDSLLSKSARVRYIILDFSLVTGVDFSAMETFHRLKRVLTGRGIQLVFCDFGFVGSELKKSGLFSGVGGGGDGAASASELEAAVADRNAPSPEDPTPAAMMVNNFESLSKALEFCENDLLARFYSIENERRAKAALPFPNGHIRVGDARREWDSPRSTQVQSAASAVLM